MLVPQAHNARASPCGHNISGLSYFVTDQARPNSSNKAYSGKQGFFGVKLSTIKSRNGNLILASLFSHHLAFISSVSVLQLLFGRIVLNFLPNDVHQNFIERLGMVFQFIIRSLLNTTFHYHHNHDHLLLFFYHIYIYIYTHTKFIFYGGGL